MQKHQLLQRIGLAKIYLQLVQEVISVCSIVDIVQL